MLVDTGVLLQIANNSESLASSYIFSLDGGGIWVTSSGTCGWLLLIPCSGTTPESPQRPCGTGKQTRAWVMCKANVPYFLS